MTENKGLIIIGIIVLLVLAVKFGGFGTESIYSGDTNWIAYNMPYSAWTVTNADIKNFYFSASPSYTRIDCYHPTSGATCIEAATITSICNTIGCPNFKIDTVGVDGVYFELPNPASAASFSITDDVNSVVLYSGIGYQNYYTYPTGGNDIFISYSSITNAFTITDKSSLPPYSPRTNTISASALSGSNWYAKLTLSGNGYISTGSFYKLTSPPPVNGACGSTNNVCLSGTTSDLADDATNYKWSCVGSNGGTTASCSVAIPTSSATIPATPTGFTITPYSSTTMVLTWTEVPGATSYNIYRSTSSTGTYILIGSDTIGTEETDEYQLTSATTYYYKISATNSAGTSTQSTAYAGTTLASCTSSWQTGAWSICSPSGTQTRTVTDANLCVTPTGTKPSESQPCTYIAPTCDQTHTQAELFSTQCGSSSTLNQTTWTCLGTSWEKTTSYYGACQSNMQCLGTASACTSIPASQTTPVSGGGGGGGSTALTPATPIITTAPTAPVTEEKNYIPLIAVLAIGGAIILRARRRR